MNIFIAGKNLIKTDGFHDGNYAFTFFENHVNIKTYTKDTHFFHNVLVETVSDNKITSQKLVDLFTAFKNTNYYEVFYDTTNHSYIIFK